MCQSKNKNIQLHVELDRGQYQQLETALKRFGYKTFSEFVREKVRGIIEKSKLTNFDNENPAKNLRCENSGKSAHANVT